MLTKNTLTVKKNEIFEAKLTANDYLAKKKDEHENFRSDLEMLEDQYSKTLAQLEVTETY